jgi:hypothetical protein
MLGVSFNKRKSPLNFTLSGLLFFGKPDSASCYADLRLVQLSRTPNIDLNLYFTIAGSTSTSRKLSPNTLWVAVT